MGRSAASGIFTATDVARDSRTVLNEGHRSTGALIRDTDGTALLLSPAVKVELERYTRAGFRDAAHLLIGLLRSQADTSDAASLGDLAWLAVLPVEDRAQFAAEYLEALDQADGLGTEQVERLIYEWQQTARSWADDAVREGLMGDLSEPLHDVEL